MRKIATMLVALGLTIGLIGAGVSATFTDGVTATQNINVGDFECKITDASPIAASNGIAADGKSLTYNAPDVLSGAAGSAPFSFTVKATGDIPVLLRITHSALSAPFSSLNDPIAPVPMDAGESKTYNVGLAWSDLAGYEGASLSITYSVDCSEVDHFVTFGPATVTGSNPWTFAVGGGQWGGVALTSKTSGKLIGNVDYSFDRTGDYGGGAPRFSLPISTNGSPTVAYYAFIDVTSCGGAATVSTASATCVVYAGSETHANWDAFVAAHPTYTIAAGSLPFVVMDVAGNYTVSNITETVTP